MAVNKSPTVTDRGAPVRVQGWAGQSVQQSKSTSCHDSYETIFYCYHYKGFGGPAHMSAARCRPLKRASARLSRGAARERYLQARCNGRAHAAWRGARPVLLFGFA